MCLGDIHSNSDSNGETAMESGEERANGLAKLRQLLMEQRPSSESPGERATRLTKLQALNFGAQMTNELRALKVRQFLERDYEYEIEGEAALGDILGDLRHLAKVDGLDFDKMVTRSLGDFEEELGDE